jgi:hypothetical protein
MSDENTTAPVTAAQIIKQAYIITAHAGGFKPGTSAELICEPSESPAPAGSSFVYNRSIAYPYAGANVDCLGINADGDVVVKWYGRDIALPHTWLESSAANDGPVIFEVTNSYDAQVSGNGLTAAIGCNTTTFAKVAELYEAMLAQQAKASTPLVDASALLNPVATYVPPQPRVRTAKKATKKATKKVAKKATKKAARKR